MLLYELHMHTKPAIIRDGSPLDEHCKYLHKMLYTLCVVSRQLVVQVATTHCVKQWMH